MADWALVSDRVVTPGRMGPATVLVSGGRVADVLPAGADLPSGTSLEDLTGLVVSPGAVDAHVHLNEPGRTEWEGFATATRAAAAGGTTTLVDMPLNSIPPTTTVDALEQKRQAATGQCWVDVAFWGGVTSEDVSHVGPLVRAGVCGVKVFLAPSGVDEFACVDGAGLRAALHATAPLGVPVLVHAEDPGPLAAAPPAAGRRYAGYLASRPPEAEIEAVRDVVAAVRETGGHAHVLHLSAAGCLPLLADAVAEGLAVTVETCPHYLSLAAEDVPDGQTTAKCAPPVRGADNREQLWAALADGRLDCVVSDHSPAPPESKAIDSGDFGAAWGGIAGLQTALAVVWTQARERGFSPVELARWRSESPARLAGLPGKGSIAAGADADLVAWDPEHSVVLEPGALLHRHPLSPWSGQRLFGIVHSTWVRGALVDLVGDPSGALLRRGERA